MRVSEKQDTKNSQLQTPTDANKETATDDIKELLLLAQNLQEEDLKLLKQMAKRLGRQSAIFYTQECCHLSQKNNLKF